MSCLSPAKAPLLEVCNLSVSLAGSAGPLPVVRSISFTVDRGRTLCLVGESGCGKSMTALALLRLLPEKAVLTGSILFEDTELTRASESFMRSLRGQRLAMIFQEPMTALNPVIRVGEQVAEVLILHRRLSHREALERAVELFRQVGIPAPERRVLEYPHQLSGGMRQRVIIAMALACEPALLLADEPTTALDVTIQGQILSLLRTLSKDHGMGLLLITHDLGVVAEMADEVGVMYAGELVEKAPVGALFASPLHPYTRGLMLSVPDASTPGTRLSTIQGTVPPPGELPAGCAFRPRCPLAEERCLLAPPCVVLPGSDGDHEVRCWQHVSGPKD